MHVTKKKKSIPVTAVTSLKKKSLGGAPKRGPPLILHLLTTGAGVGEAYDGYNGVLYQLVPLTLKQDMAWTENRAKDCEKTK